MIPLLLMLGLSLTAPAMGQSEAALQPYNTRFYLLRTNLEPAEAKVFARHMDRVFKEYKGRFEGTGLRRQREQPMNLYIFRTREGFKRFMDGHGIDAANSGGMFVVQPSLQGLATFVEGRSRGRVFSVLQHEGFHQFAWEYIGQNLPIWVNEGMAQYFEDGILVEGRFVFKQASAERISSIQGTIERQQYAPFEQMLQLSPEQWIEILQSNPSRAALLYDQAWSMVFFLITARDGRFVGPFERYLQELSKGRDGKTAFVKVFELRPDHFEPFERAWRRWAMQVKPDPLSTATQRMEFLGAALKFLHERDPSDPPRNLDLLRYRLKKIGFQLTRQPQHGPAEHFSASDERMFRYALPDRTRDEFVLKQGRTNEPPMVTAPRMRPQPILTWRRGPTGELVYEIIYR
jgi:hypothetical protein